MVVLVLAIPMIVMVVMTVMMVILMHGACIDGDGYGSGFGVLMVLLLLC